MHREVLQACLPCLIALAIGCAGWVAIARLAGGRADWRRLLRLHRCEQGGVQSLAFVLTFPVLIVIILFIVQISQLMIGTIVVHYAAFAAARSASVWIPAHYGDPPNVLPNLGSLPYEEDNTFTIAIPDEPGDNKLRRIRTAAILGCAPISPSRDPAITGGLSAGAIYAIDGTQLLYSSIVPGAVAQNPRINDRLRNKIAYADTHTAAILEWRDGNRDSLSGRSYNPRNSPNPDVVWNPWEVGWQDPITVYVVHRYALLLPGAGRFLAEMLVRPVGLPQRVLAHVDQLHPDWRTNPLSPSGVATVLLPASATVVNEGLKSRYPYVSNPVP